MGKSQQLRIRYLTGVEPSAKYGRVTSTTPSTSLILSTETLESRKPELQKQSKSLKEECKKAKAHWVELKEKEDALREEHEDVMERYSSQMKELKSAKLEIRKLSNDIELSELMKKKLEADIKTRKAKLREDKEREQKRRDAMSKETENQSKHPNMRIHCF